MRRPALGPVLGRRPRRRIGAALALVAAVVVVVALVLGAASPSSPRAAGNPTSAAGATAVQRRDLVETDTESGTLSYADPQTVYDRLGGTITWLPSVGQVIKPGQTLFKVDGEPVILMNGTTPAYRDLTPSDSAGQDILELNRNLVDLGFNPDGIVSDDQWQAATTAGVDVLQAYLGETETGGLSLGEVVFLPGAQLIGAVDGTLGSTGGSSNPANSGSSSSANDPAPPDAPEFVSLTTKPKPPKRGPKHKPGAGSRLTTLEALIALLRAELAELKAEKSRPSAKPSSSSSGSSSGVSHGSSSGGSRSSAGGGTASSAGGGSASSASGGGGGGGAASPILQTTSPQLIVTVELDASKQSEAKVGEPVTVQMPAGNTVNGTISAVSPVAQSSSNSNNGNSSSPGGASNNGNSSSSGSTIPVTIRLSGHTTGAGLDQAAVSVNFAQARASNVLSVPVTALLATAGGGYAVQEAAPPHRLIPVTTGLFAAGYVEVSGPGIFPGLQVTDSQG